MDVAFIELWLTDEQTTGLGNLGPWVKIRVMGLI